SGCRSVSRKIPAYLGRDAVVKQRRVWVNVFALELNPPLEITRRKKTQNHKTSSLTKRSCPFCGASLTRATSIRLTADLNPAPYQRSPHQPLEAFWHRSIQAEQAQKPDPSRCVRGPEVHRESERSRPAELEHVCRSVQPPATSNPF